MKRTLAAVAALMMLSAVVAVAQQDRSFPDVADDHPRKAAIEEAVNRGWFEGYPDGRFQPDKAISPTQIANVFLRAFDDVPPTRAEMAEVMKAGKEALKPATSSDASGTTTTTTATDAGTYYGTDRPIIIVRNLVVYSAHCRNLQARIEYLEIREEGYDVEAECRRDGSLWEAIVLYDPAGIRRSTLVLYYELLVEDEWVDRYKWLDYNIDHHGWSLTEDDNGVRILADNIRIEDEVIRLNKGNRRVEAVIICERYPAFLYNEDDIPVPPERCQTGKGNPQ